MATARLEVHQGLFSEKETTRGSSSADNNACNRPFSDPSISNCISFFLLYIREMSIDSPYGDIL